MDESRDPQSEEPAGGVQALLASLDEVRAAKFLSGFDEFETSVLLGRAHNRTYKQIALSLKKPDGEPYSEIWIRKTMARLRDKHELKDADDVTIAFMVARTTCNLPLYTNEHLSSADDLMARIVADRRIDEVVEILRSKEARKMIADAQSSGPKARRARLGRHAITFELLVGIGFAFFIVGSTILIAILLDWNNLT